MTNGLTTYEGFDFAGFANVDQTTYAVKPDGLYRLRAGDDDGTPVVSARVRFGARDQGSPFKKHHDMAYFGLATDGQVYAKLVGDDGTERTYRVTQRGTTWRTKTKRGATARVWELSLELTDVTFAQLDLVEQVTPTSLRRWTR
jgi:hypothetical protein